MFKVGDVVKRTVYGISGGNWVDACYASNRDPSDLFTVESVLAAGYLTELQKIGLEGMNHTFMSYNFTLIKPSVLSLDDYL